MFAKRLLLAMLLTFPLAAAHAQTDAQTAQSSSPAQLAAFSGEYTDAKDPDTPLSFYAQDGKLYLESERQVPTELEPVSPTEFHQKDSKVIFRFTLDGAGHAVSLVPSALPDTLYTRTGDPVHHLFHDYQRREVMIPMRDGVKLHAILLVPADIHTPLPFLIQRTPYGVDGTNRASFHGGRPELARAGYIYVAEDIRGRFKSEGQFVMSRPLQDHKNPHAIDESTDTWDTVEWLLKNVPGNNGRAGFVGTSYPGFLAMSAGLYAHPAVKAISPQAPMIDVWMGDDFFHNGAFRQSYGYDYVLMMESSKENTEVDYGKTPDGKPIDGYDYFLKRGSFDQDAKQSPAKTTLPTWKLFLDHPAYDEYWRSRGVEYHLTKVEVPTLSVGGYYDQEDMWGPQEEYKRLEAHDAEKGADHKNFLVLGPWRHGSWSSSSRHLGNLQYGEPIGREFRAEIEAKFFAHYLKDEPGTNASGFDLEDTASFQTGSNQWKHYSSFPPPSSHSTPYCLADNGSIQQGTSCASGKTSYISDPANPVPYRHLPIQPTYGTGSDWYNWLTEDQRFATERKDVAHWQTAPLTGEVTLTGEVIADIVAATTGSDNDLIVKLIDQYPDDDPDPAMRGYQLITNAEILRGRYLKSFEHPAALEPGKPYEYKFSLHDVDHVFKPGHRLLIEVQSTWFPLYDRNPQTFVPSIMTAPSSAYKAQTITILSPKSTVYLPVVQ